MFNFHLSGQQPRQSERLRTHMDDPQGISRLATALSEYIRGAGAGRQVVVLCVGTDRSTGDCLGPLVGSQLLAKGSKELSVYGSLDKPVHASNLQQTLTELGSIHQNPFLIAVDACLGKLDSVGYISLAKGALKPGAGVHKNLPMVGEACLTGIVNVGGFMEYMVLQNTRLGIVMNMAGIISEVVFGAYYLARRDYCMTP